MIEKLLSRFAATPIQYHMGGIPVSKAKTMCDFAVIEKLSANENALGISPKAVEAMTAQMEQANFYPNVSDYQIKKKLSKQQGIPEKQIILTHGGTVALTLVGEVFLNPGDEIVLSVPTYQAYRNMARKGCAVLREVETDENLHIDFTTMREAINDKTKIVIVCNPNNPTGIYEEREKLLTFIDELPKSVVVIVDEAYIQFAGGLSASMVPYISDERNMIVVQTFSKIYGMAGLRLGYVMANQEIITALEGDMDAYEPNILALAAGDAALDDDEFVRETMEMVDEGRTYLTKELQKLGIRVFSSYTNFLMFDCGMRADMLTERVLLESGVLIRGTFRYPRITIGTRGQNEKFIEAMTKICAEGGA